ncbi:MAG: Qat anti-phage system TatD family nuclease QatD [Janthinobacterium lividum]
MIDFHCHLDLYPDPEAVVKAITASGDHVLSVTTTPKAWKMTSALAKGSVRIRTALGMHPQLAHERHGELALFEALLPQTDYVGEIGLDGGPEYRVHADIQRKVLRSVLQMTARAGGRVMSIHSRHAASEVLDMLQSAPTAGSFILHWFSGSKAELDRAVSQGCWFSVGPPMLRSQKGRALVSAMPPGRVLTETDGPFGTVSGQPLKAGEVHLAVEGLASIWSVTPGAARDRIADNLRKLALSKPQRPL